MLNNQEKDSALEVRNEYIKKSRIEMMSIFQKVENNVKLTNEEVVKLYELLNKRDDYFYAFYRNLDNCLCKQGR